jgi:hypothetical protein
VVAPCGVYESVTIRSGAPPCLLATPQPRGADSRRGWSASTLAPLWVAAVAVALPDRAILFVNDVLGFIQMRPFSASRDGSALYLCSDSACEDPSCSLRQPLLDGTV